MRSQDKQESSTKYTELQIMVKYCKKGQTGVTKSGNEKFRM